MTRKALGKGISALIGENESDSTAGFREVSVGLLDPNPFQSRQVFAKDKLAELAQSISVHGLVQPIVVRKNGGRFQIIAGERRWRAARSLGLQKVPVVIKAESDAQVMEVALIENIQRENLNPMEEARAYYRLANEFGLTQEEVALQTGKERSTVANFLRLLKLPSLVQDLVKDRQLSMGHARALLSLENTDSQEILARKASKLGWSVRQVESVIAQEKKSSRQESERKRQDPNVMAATARLESVLGTRVRIVSKRSGSKGRIELDYASQDELQRLYEHLVRE